MDGRTRPDLIGLAVTLIIYVVRLLLLPFSSCVHLGFFTLLFFNLRGVFRKFTRQGVFWCLGKFPKYVEYVRV